MTLQDTAEAIHKAASQATIGGGTVALLGGFTASDIAAFGGVLVAMVGLCVNIVFKVLHYRLAKAKATADPGE